MSATMTAAGAVNAGVMLSARGIPYNPQHKNHSILNLNLESPEDTRRRVIAAKEDQIAKLRGTNPGTVAATDAVAYNSPGQEFASIDRLNADLNGAMAAKQQGDPAQKVRQAQILTPNNVPGAPDFSGAV